ncbi:hypothetical protein A2U01_0096094 [Trifolium medium]|uniref:Uncharacterized protein n=1 Tax=Trifolium medium TaxID=97028 RepID=A0A392UR85_9FABA|nr:hypothetical protein [Trifolium medium]
MFFCCRLPNQVTGSTRKRDDQNRPAASSKTITNGAGEKVCFSCSEESPLLCAALSCL